jgi:branched-chain amino acid transport system permease protein
LVDPINLITTFASFFGIYAILTVSLNLEYGYAGQPNFGQVLFYGLGAFVAAIVTANLLPFLAGKVIGNICDAGAYSSRIAISSSFPVIAVSTWLFALIGAMFAGGIVGLLVSYPAIRVKEEWYLSMILLVAGEAFAIIVENTQQIGCGFNGVDGIQNPFYWIYSSYSSTSFSNTLIGLNFPGMIYAAIILGIAALCFLLSQRLVNSPYGRLLKSIRDDKVAAESLGKDVAKVRRQIMVIGSVMAGLAGGLYVFYLGTATADDYVPAVTFSIWVMMILGGYANNRGAIAGAFVITLLNRGSVLLSELLQPIVTSLNPAIIIYLVYILESVILILLLAFRPHGLIPESRIETKAYDLFDFGKRTSAPDESVGTPPEARARQQPLSTVDPTTKTPQQTRQEVKHEKV